MSYIVWDGDKCVLFNSKQHSQAEDYVFNNKSMSIDWLGWDKTVTNDNHVTAINQFDTKLAYLDAPKYLKPSTKPKGGK